MADPRQAGLAENSEQAPPRRDGRRTRKNHRERENLEKRAYYEFLYETGAAQSDAAELTAENIDWQEGLLVYHNRKKLGPDSEPARLSVGAKLRELLESLPKSGDLFPTIKKAKPNARSTEFRRRCRIAGVFGVSLHSYRHSWAQRAKACGYPQRFAQDALGHSSRAVHEAYAKGAFVIVPPLDEYESIAQRKVIAMPLRLTLSEQTDYVPRNQTWRVTILPSSICESFLSSRTNSVNR